jgi:hypothetical protein
MSTRDNVSALIRTLVDGWALPPMTPLDCWMLRRRLEWASQLIQAKLEEGIAPPPTVSVQQVLDWALIRTWDSDGCIAMWMHGERKGSPHPRKSPGQ